MFKSPMILRTVNTLSGFGMGPGSGLLALPDDEEEVIIGSPSEPILRRSSNPMPLRPIFSRQDSTQSISPSIRMMMPSSGERNR